MFLFVTDHVCINQNTYRTIICYFVVDFNHPLASDVAHYTVFYADRFCSVFVT